MNLPNAAMAEAAAVMGGRARLLSPPRTVKVGVDLGTAFTVVLALDEDDRPLAGAFAPADVVRDGVVVDFLGAVDLVRRLRDTVCERLGVEVYAAAGAYPPGVPYGDVQAVRHVIEAADMECVALVDEPTAANAVLGIRHGAVVDVGGGTTGIALIEDGVVVDTADEPTGGVHVGLVIAGALGVDVREAERLKCDPSEQRRLFPVVKPVMEKVATIVDRYTAGRDLPQIVLVGGSVAFPGFADVVAEVTGIPTVIPDHPLFVTPLGIARVASPTDSC